MMKISVSMLALPAALWCACATAQSNVSVYGVVDMGLVREGGAPKGNVTTISSGVASGTRLGFKGAEDLGGGMKASFVLESGINADTGASGQGGLLFGRQALVGLGGAIGTVTLGRQYSPYYKALRDVGDPFGAVSLAGRAGNIMATNTRVNNMLELTSATVAGMRVDLAYGAGEAAGDAARNRTLGGALSYADRRLNVQLAFNQINNAAATDHVNNTLLAASFDAAVVTMHAAYAVNRGAGKADSHDIVTGITLPIAGDRLLFSAVYHDDRTPADRNALQWGLGYSHPLSRRMDLYAAYATISNRRGADFKVGNATDSGSGSKALNLGARHSF